MAIDESNVWDHDGVGHVADISPVKDLDAFFVVLQHIEVVSSVTKSEENAQGAISISCVFDSLFGGIGELQHFSHNRCNCTPLTRAHTQPHP